jgi:hypothetical protein
MYPKVSNEIYSEIHRLQKLIKGADVNFWIGPFFSQRIFQYPSGTVERWKQKLNDMLDQDLRDRPHVLHNGGSP